MTPLHIVTGGLSLNLHGCPTIKRLWHKLRPLATIRGQSVPPALRAELGRVDLPGRAHGRVRKRLCVVTGTLACQLFPSRELPSPMLTARKPDKPLSHPIASLVSLQTATWSEAVFHISNGPVVPFLLSRIFTLHLHPVKMLFSWVRPVECHRTLG